MVLHRDIHWIGRQWAVTGYGIQAVDQRLQGAFDIEISRLGDAGLLDALREFPRFSATDFARAYKAACSRFAIAPDSLTVRALEQAAESEPPPPPRPPPPKPLPLAPEIRLQEIRLHLGPQPTPAKFLQQWRIRR